MTDIANAVLAWCFFAHVPLTPNGLMGACGLSYWLGSWKGRRDLIRAATAAALAAQPTTTEAS